MNNKKKFTSFFIALVFTLSLLFNNFTGLISTADVAVAETKVAVNAIDDGAILHAWNWSLNTIKEKLPEIKEAGYKAVQTSPVQGTKENSMQEEYWWLLYQPTNFKIGNAQLGSRDDLKSLCEEAEKYGIKIIVDVIFNHTANAGSGDQQIVPSQAVDPEILNDSSMWHTPFFVNNWNSRYEVTQGGISLPDLNTSNKKLQNMIVDFLNDAVDCGVDGFRIDTAKHIELPNDDPGSDFWPYVLGNVKNRDQLFIYGEVLQGGADNYAGYLPYMNLTTSYYGEKVREAVGFKDANNTNVGYSVASAQNYQVPAGTNPVQLVTWVESHDTYNDINDSLKTRKLTDYQIKMAWAIIGSRAQSAPLFFNRPAGSSPSNALPGNMGDAGNDMWKDQIVVATNNFRNAMAGESEYLRTQGNEVMMVERGTKGMMIVNLGGSKTINADTNLPDGQYKDSFGGKTFTVSNGKLSGQIDGGTIAVIETNPGPVEPEVSSSVATGTKFKDSLNPTLTAKNTTTATYSIDGGTAVTYTDGTTIKLGENAKIGDIVTLTLTGKGEDGKIVTKTYEYEKAPIENSIAKIKLPSGWSKAYIYVYDGSVTSTKELAAWPGVAMTKDADGLYSYTLPEGWGDNTKVIFNDGSNQQIPAAEQEGFSLPINKIGTYADGNWTLEDIQTEPEVSSSVADGTEFTGSLNVTLSAKNTTEATYSINGETAITYTDGESIPLGNGDPVGTSYKLVLTGTNSEGKTVTQTYNYKKVETPVITTSVAKIKLPSGWTSANIYVYDESGSTVKEVAKWPGVAMTKEADGLYSYTLPEGWGDNTKVIFNNGSAQIPAAEQEGFSLPTNKIGTYADGQWTLEEIITPITISEFKSDKLSPQYKDTTMTLTADATGGNGSLQYKFTATEKTTGKETVISDYSTKNEVEWTPLAAGTYEVKVSVKDNDGTVEERRFEFEIKTIDVTLNSLTLDKTEGKINEVVNISAEAEGGVGALNYKFYYKKDGKYTLIQQYSTSNTAEWTPTEKGSYIVYVDVRDGAGVTKSLNTAPYVVNGDTLKINSFEADKTSVEANTKVTLTANAEGGTGELSYKFYYKYNDKYTKIQDYSTKNTANWTPTEDGYYRLYVDVKDGAGNVKTKAFDFIVGEVEDIQVEFTLSTKSGVVNTPVTIDATSEGGVNPVTYKFYYKKDGAYTMIKDYSDSSSIEWTPEEEGTYAIYVAAKDASGKIDAKYINFTVGKGVEITDISLDKTTIKVGDSVNIKTTATGNSNLQYRVAVHDFENTWTTLHDFKSSNTTTWKPEIADKYVIWVDVIDEDGNYDSKSIEVTVTE